MLTCTAVDCVSLKANGFFPQHFKEKQLRQDALVNLVRYHISLFKGQQKVKVNNVLTSLLSKYKIQFITNTQARARARAIYMTYVNGTYIRNENEPPPHRYFNKYVFC